MRQCLIQSNYCPPWIRILFFFSRYIQKKKKWTKLIYIGIPEYRRVCSYIIDLSKKDDSSFRRCPHPPPPAPITIIAFYEGTGSEIQGNKLADILQWSISEFEHLGESFLALFPLPENLHPWNRAPIIDQKVFEAFRSRRELRDALKSLFQKMIWFFGFKTIEEEGKSIVRNLKTRLPSF